MPIIFPSSFTHVLPMAIVGVVSKVPCPNFTSVVVVNLNVTGCIAVIDSLCRTLEAFSRSLVLLDVEEVLIVCSIEPEVILEISAISPLAKADLSSVAAIFMVSAVSLGHGPCS